MPQILWVEHKTTHSVSVLRSRVQEPRIRLVNWRLLSTARQTRGFTSIFMLRFPTIRFRGRLFILVRSRFLRPCHQRLLRRRRVSRVLHEGCDLYYEIEMNVRGSMVLVPGVLPFLYLPAFVFAFRNESHLAQPHVSIKSK